MATSPDFLRFASSATRALADTTLDNLRDAALVVDASHRYFPIVLANAAARQYLKIAAPLLEVQLASVLGAASTAKLESLLASVTDPRIPCSRVLSWRLAAGEQPVMTEIKALESAPGQRLVMLSFTPRTPLPDAAAVDPMPYDLFILDVDLKVTYANAGAIRTAGSIPGGAVGCSALMLMPLRLFKPEVFERALHGQPFHESLVFAEHARPARRFEIDMQPLKSASGIGGLVVMSLEVTEPRLNNAQGSAEWRLRRSEELLRATIANAADTLFLLDTTMRVRFVNKSVDGLSSEQIIGRAIDALLPEAARAGVLHKLGNLLETGEAITFEFESFRAGRAQYFENRAVLVRDDGVATGISISTRDITERKRLEQEILDVSGRERQSIGRDLHDGLGQELTGTALMLRALASRIQERCPDAVENINEIIGHVNQSIETARSLARGLLPVRTEAGGLIAALRALATRSRDVYGLEVSFSSALCPEVDLAETHASHLYRIAQEALTNAARHGRATLVDISLIARADGFRLRITDNGVGLGRATPSPSGMGLKIMKYRADMIGAKFYIASNEPQGTIVTIIG